MIIALYTMCILFDAWNPDGSVRGSVRETVETTGFYSPRDGGTSVLLLS